MNMRGQTAPWQDLPSVWRAIDWRGWWMWPLPQLAVAALVLSLFSAALVWAVWPQEGLDALQIAAQRQAQEVQLQSQKARLAALALTVKETAISGQELAATQGRWPTLSQASQVLMALYQQAQRHGLQVDSFKPAPLLTQDEFRIYAVSLRVQGSFAQLMSWSDGVFQQAALWVPEKWVMTATPAGLVTLDALLHLYVRPDDALHAPAAGNATGRPPSHATVPQMVTDPFIGPALKASQGSPLLTPGSEVHPLRRWPLQDVHMVGSFKHEGAWHALVWTQAGLFSLTVGGRLGAEGGQLVGIDETALRVSVPVQQAGGHWGSRLEILPIRLQVKK
jgi:Tfp pilus assembly protein PilO